MINLSEFSDEEWLNILPNYQRNLIQNLLSCGLDKQDIIQLWLNQENTSNTAGYGVKNNIGNFYKNFLKEINDLFCNDTKYSQERKHIQEYFSSTGKISFLAGISQYISNHISSLTGISEVAVTPAIVLTLSIIGQTGINAYCATVNIKKPTNPSP